MELRPYQHEAIQAVERELHIRGFRSTLLCLPTGCGKTVVFAEIAKREVCRGGRILVLAHRGELLEQAIDKIKKVTGIEAGLEKADSKAIVDEDGFPYMIVVGSVQSMSRPSRLKRFLPDEFSLIIIDECHHSLSKTYRSILDYFTGAQLLGVTATPDRGDGAGLDCVFETIAFDYSIVDAVRDGFLVPIRAQTIPLELNIQGVTSQSGDYALGSLGNALEQYLPAIAREMAQRCKERKTVVFTPLIATSQKMQPYLEEAGLTVREVNGTSPDRAELIDWFDKAPKGSVLLNSMLLTEGWDCPSVDCVVVLRATKVRALFVQMVGRGTRLSPGKENLLLLDFIWLTASHELCRPACLIGEDVADDVAETLDEKIKGCGEMGLELSPEALADAESETVKKREDALAKKLAEQRKKKGNLIDPLQYAVSVGQRPLYPSGVEVASGRPTMEQMKALETHGIACPDSAQEADHILKTLKDRNEQGLSAPRQIRFLSQKGFRNVENWSFAQAKRLIDRFAVNGWRCPAGIDPAHYQPPKLAL